MKRFSYYNIFYLPVPLLLYFCNSMFQCYIYSYIIY